jgi:hypothetical protein
LLLLSFYLSLAMLLFLLTLVHIQSNPSLFFVIIFYLIEHQTPYTHLFNFNYVSEIIGGMLQLPSSLHLSLGSLLGLFMSRCCWTKVHTLIFRRVNLHTHLEIVVKSISYLSNY